MSQIGSFPQNIMKPPPDQSMSICTSFFSTFPPQTSSGGIFVSPFAPFPATNKQGCFSGVNIQQRSGWSLIGLSSPQHCGCLSQQRFNNLLEFIDFCLSYQNTSIFVLYDTKSPYKSLKKSDLYHVWSWLTPAGSLHEHEGYLTKQGFLSCPPTKCLEKRGSGICMFSRSQEAEAP